jgi:hypothetical protein
MSRRCGAWSHRFPKALRGNERGDETGPLPASDDDRLPPVAAMLRCTGIETGGPDRSEFRILEEGAPAAPETLDKVARIAALLLRENNLAGRFAVAGPGVLALELPESERTFFHNGIVFAALDAINDPLKNPTLTLRAAEEP